MLQVTGLEAAYGRARVLFGVDLTVRAGELACVLGRNGVGKTTLLNSIMGLLSPTAGTVVFDGTEVTRMRTFRRVRLGMGYVPQGHETFPQLTVWENLQVTLEAMGRRDGTAIDDALDVFPALTGLLRRRAGFLSGGQQQQLAIARALVTRPRLLILDEPTEGVQPSIVLEIAQAIEQLRGDLAVLLVEQHLDLALRLADTFTILDGGAVRHSGTAGELRTAEVERLLAV
ncbi:urea ABC transporter ATP-binding subunit UrtE [Actinomadura sp. WMMB 499]|uniref:urea ABC transporter ATP-binding subunit UrtE n=1 Tax=Actinomadura sp. WMMB 499 TaxID=1219491 RepID=UPI00124764A3|nr:urea ABC transporter ATP-binding subunit UrtE [Actinomadura sp. WMMB 499]QFG26779.1 urea ABC transporter ATP-binding subunit UrtE [Actinomadura sp. WMMB 499]